MQENEVKELNEELKKVDKMTKKRDKERSDEKKKNDRKRIENPIIREIVEWIEVLVIAFVLAMVIKTFVIETTEVSGDSMLQTLEHKQKLLVNRFIYNFTTPDRGDIIVFLPDNEDKNYIKRIIGLPGETIDLRDGNVYVNEILLEEDYIDQKTYSLIKHPKEFPYTLGEGEYFAMGDNRGNSMDSRSADVGVLTIDKIRGKAICRIYPINTMCTFGEVEYPGLSNEVSETFSDEDLVAEELEEAE